MSEARLRRPARPDHTILRKTGMDIRYLLTPERHEYVSYKLNIWDIGGMSSCQTYWRNFLSALTSLSGSGEDEMVLPCGIDECREKNGGCGHLCVSTVEPNYYCQSQPGHKLIKKFNCEDIDECVAPRSCFQYCTNTTGGFHYCSQPGYHCHSSNYMHCKADSGNPYLISYRAHMSSPETP
ncbi:hypothetical protein O3P69_008324 [Scylla paramamosain]|uniref:Uncharacterized protein n=1 Tax=Scylla paramamosain TaxID=85552 RepID=A0AAW0SJN8_SCYPA